MVRKEDIKMCNDETLTLGRPAWTQDDLHAYRHKIVRGSKYVDYYVKKKGIR